MFRIRTCLILFWVLCCFCNTDAQSYFKELNSGDLQDQKIAEFNNRDLLIGNSSTAPTHSGDEVGIINLQRIDYCGNVIWSRAYNYDAGYLVLKDIAINSNDEIFMFGSHYQGLTESVFVSKITDVSGNEADFRVYSTGTVDHFSYSIDVINNKLIVYGLVFDFNSSKEGFIGIFDQNLNINTGYKFVPFESSGNAVLSEGEDIIAWSGPFIYKFNKDNNLEWAYNTIDQQELSNVSGPYNINSDWIFEANVNGSSFLYSLDLSGKLLWKSDLFNATSAGGGLSLLQDGKLLFTYNRETTNGTELCFATIDQSGNLLDEKRLVHDYTMNTGLLLQRSNENKINVIGNKNLFTIGGIEIENFILQFEHEELSGDCYVFENYTNSLPNMLDLRLEPLDISLAEFQLELVSREKLKSILLEDVLKDICDPETDLIPTTEDKLLPCEDDWDISLPLEFTWDDGYPFSDRSLMLAGTYSARNIDCEDQMVLEYNLLKDECGCEIFLPNTFSPNSDGQNDILALGVFCELQSISLSIYNQWGDRIFRSDNANRLWDGDISQRAAPIGVYSALLSYEWMDAAGEIHQERKAQTITLLR